MPLKIAFSCPQILTPSVRLLKCHPPPLRYKISSDGLRETEVNFKHFPSYPGDLETSTGDQGIWSAPGRLSDGKDTSE